MLWDSDAASVFARNLEYLAGTLGTDSHVQLNALARALKELTWRLPPPERIPADQAFYGFRRCMPAYALTATKNGTGSEFSYAEKLLEPIAGKLAVKKMCFLCRVAGFTPGFRMVAVRARSGPAGYVANAVVSANEARELLGATWTCVFVRE